MANKDAQDALLKLAAIRGLVETVRDLSSASVSLEGIYKITPDDGFLSKDPIREAIIKVGEIVELIVEALNIELHPELTELRDESLVHLRKETARILEGLNEEG